MPAATTRTHTYTKKYLEMIFNQSQGIFLLINIFADKIDEKGVVQTPLEWVQN